MKLKRRRILPFLSSVGRFENQDVSNAFGVHVLPTEKTALSWKARRHFVVGITFKHLDCFTTERRIGILFHDRNLTDIFHPQETARPSTASRAGCLALAINVCSATVHLLGKQASGATSCLGGGNGWDWSRCPGYERSVQANDAAREGGGE